MLSGPGDYVIRPLQVYFDENAEFSDGGAQIFEHAALSP